MLSFSFTNVITGKIRLLDVPVPVTYGPTADMNPFG